MIAPVSIIIPILNEAETLPELLAGLEGQTLLPQEIIFVDAGSTDGGMDLVLNWWRAIAWPGGDCRILSRPGAFPGAARNAGIVEAKGKWIAFLDGGIWPEPGWLKALLTFATDHAIEGVFGVGRFCGEGTVARTVCALSYGQGMVLPILPASMFDRDVFQKVGVFCPDLRAYEDTRWVNEYLKLYGERQICTEAVVNYRHFPRALSGAFTKWFVYAANAVKAGAFHAEQWRYFLFFGVLAVVLIFHYPLGAGILAVYVAARGGLDPIRRSASWRWWKGEPFAPVAALFLGAGLDVAKLGGFAAGHLARVRSHLMDLSAQAPPFQESIRQELRLPRLSLTTFINLLGRGGVLLFPLLVAYLHGATGSTDALFWVTGLIFWLGGSMSVAAELVSVPMMTKRGREGGRPNDEMLLAVSLRGLRWGLLVTAALLVFGGGSVAYAPILDPALRSIGALYLMEVLPVIPMMVVGGIWTGALVAVGVFAASGWAIGARWVVVLAGTAVLSDPSLLPFLGALFTVGELARIGVLLVCVRAAGFWKDFRARVGKFSSPPLPIEPIVLQTFAMFAINANPVIDKAMGAMLGPGKISLFEYAWALYLLPTGIVTSGLLLVWYSEWSRIFSDQGAIGLGATVGQAFFRTLTWMAPMTALVSAGAWWWWSHPFSLGGLSTDDIREFAGVVGVLGLGLPGVLAGLVAMRGLLVIQATRAVLLVSTGKCLLNVYLNWVLMGPLGLMGIALSTAVTETVTAGVLYSVFVRDLRNLASRPMDA